MISHRAHTRRPNPARRSARLFKFALAAAGALLLGACATVPTPLAGTYSPLTPQQAARGGAGGTVVRWGGEIIKTEPEPQQTCFYVLSRSLDNTARPSRYNPSHGRFVACHGGFYDPKIYAPGRDVTVTGTVHGIVSKMVGKYDYAYPRVQARTIYLWPKEPVVVAYPVPVLYPPPPFWGPGFYSPFWYQPGFIYFEGDYHHRRHWRRHH